jgi:hypothetical protein
MSRLRSVLLDTAAVATVMVVALPAAASVVMETSYSAWESAAGTPGVETSCFYGAAAGGGCTPAPTNPVNGVTLADGTTLAFGDPMTVAQVGESWGSFYCSAPGQCYSGQVLSSMSSTSVNFTVSPVTAFGMYIQPAALLFEFKITLTLSDNQGTVSQVLPGSGNAAFFGWVGTGVTQFTISSEPSGFGFSSGFGVGDFYSAQPAINSHMSAPEPGSLPLLAAAGIGLLAAPRRGRTRQSRRGSATALSRYGPGSSSRSAPSHGS